MIHESMPSTPSSENKTRKTSLKYRLMTFIVAIVYGGFLAGLPLMVFKDRANYLLYAAYSWSILSNYWSQSPLIALTNEPIWLLIDSVLAMFLSSETTLRIIIFVPAFVTAWLVLQQNPRQFVWLVLILLFPAVIKNYIINLRQGLAISVFLLGWFTEKRPLRWLLMGTTPFIHASFFFVLGLLGMSKFALKLRLGPDIRTLLFAILGIIAGLGVGWIAAVLGARQSQEYDFAMANVSGLGFIFWGAVLVVMCFQGRGYMRSHTFELGAIVFYLATYFFIEITARIFESMLILVLLAGMQLTGWRRAAFISLIIISAVLQYIPLLDQPWLGFGV